MEHGTNKQFIAVAASFLMLLSGCNNRTKGKTRPVKDMDTVAPVAKVAPKWDRLFIKNEGWFGGDGIFGILGKVPFLNKLLTQIFKYWNLKTKKFFSWPNIKAKKLIVPERIGNITPKQIAIEAEFLIKHKKHLEKIRNKLLKQRGGNGAAQKLAYIILNSIKKLN